MFDFLRRKSQEAVQQNRPMPETRNMSHQARETTVASYHNEKQRQDEQRRREEEARRGRTRG